MPACIGEALNRKRILMAQLVVMTTTSAVLCALALFGEIRIWHIIVAGAVNGLVWASELAVRRRMIGDVVPPDRVTAAIAFNSMTNSIARVLGPLAGGAVFQTLGLGGAYFVAALLYLAAAIAVIGLDFRQEKRRLYFRRIAADIAEGVVVARRNPAILAVVLVSIVMNVFAFSYSALIAPWGSTASACRRRLSGRSPAPSPWARSPAVSRCRPAGCGSMAGARCCAARSCSSPA